MANIDSNKKNFRILLVYMYMDLIRKIFELKITVTSTIIRLYFMNYTIVYGLRMYIIYYFF